MTEEDYLSAGYEKEEQIISIVQANKMAFVTAGPFVVLEFIIWLGVFHLPLGLKLSHAFGLLLLYILTIPIHEGLHGLGFLPFVKNGVRSIKFGFMKEYLTPYCHCREGLKPRAYLFALLLPFGVLGIGTFIIGLLTQEPLFLWLSALSLLSAGGDTTIAVLLRKYLSLPDCFIKDHVSECGFVAYVK